MIRYEGGRMTLAGLDFLDLVLDLIELNPAIKIDVRDGWFQRVLEKRQHPEDELPQHAGEAARDDPIRELRRSYERNIRREQRNERYGRVVVLLFGWFFASFTTVALSPLVVSQPISIPLAGLIGGLVIRATWVLGGKIFR